MALGRQKVPIDLSNTNSDLFFQKSIHARMETAFPVLPWREVWPCDKILVRGFERKRDLKHLGPLLFGGCFPSVLSSAPWEGQ